MSRAYIAVGLDGTLAEFYGHVAPLIGRPVPAMLARVKAWLAEGTEVRIITPRVAPPERGAMNEFLWREDEVKRVRAAIEAWCLEHVGQVLPVSCQIDAGMMQWWDTLAVGVDVNNGATANKQFLALLRNMTDWTECWFDHHGYCQAHGWMNSVVECPHSQARKVLLGYGLAERNERGVIVEKAGPCPQCGQTDTGQTGEYPCQACGMPTLHDAKEAGDTHGN